MKKYVKIGVATICILIVLLGMKACSDQWLFDVGLDQTFTSPSGQTTITLRYDYVSRPYLFYKGKQIFAYNKNGFAETVYFDVEWITDSNIRFYCDQFNEEYYITLE